MSPMEIGASSSGSKIVRPLRAASVWRAAPGCLVPIRFTGVRYVLSPDRPQVLNSTPAHPGRVCDQVVELALVPVRMTRQNESLVGERRIRVMAVGG